MHAFEAGPDIDLRTYSSLAAPRMRARPRSRTEPVPDSGAIVRLVAGSGAPIRPPLRVA
jgi:hypothetical protein